MVKPRWERPTPDATVTKEHHHANASYVRMIRVEGIV
jgi:hypothetical protein